MYVSDLERSLRFYDDVLGFVVSETMADVRTSRGEPSDSLLKLRDVKLHAVVPSSATAASAAALRPAEVARPRAWRTMNDLGFTHLSVKGAGRQAALREARALGVEIDRNTVIGSAG